MNNRDFQIIKKILFREITAHKYQTLEMGDVWVTLEKEILFFKSELTKIIANNK